MHPTSSSPWSGGPPPAPAPLPPARWRPVPILLATTATVVLVGSLVTAVAVDDGDEPTLSPAGPTSTTGPHDTFDPAAPDPAAWVTDPAPDLDLPAEWDERVTDLVAFVEEERGLEFVSPVHIEFLTEEEFQDELSTDEEDLADEEIVEEMEALQQLVPMLRALGLMEGNVDLVETVEDFSSVAVGAFYSSEERRIVVPTTDPTPLDEVTLVHELTHALQDQYFDLESAPSDADDGDGDGDGDGEPQGYNSDGPWLTPLVEGDATRIENAWVRSRPRAEREEMFENAPGPTDPDDGIEDFPTFIVASFTSSYSLGQSMVGLLAAEAGNEGVNEAFHDMDTTAAHFTDPTTYLDGVEFGEIDPPAVPADAEVVDDGPFDAWDFFAVLAQRIDIADALAAADSWHAGSYTTFEEADGRVCVRLRATGASTDDNEVLTAAFEEWVDAAPDGTDATFDEAPPDAETGVIGTCDPGADAALQHDRLDVAFDALSLRSSLAWELVHYTGSDVDEAWEAAECATTGLLADGGIDLADVYAEVPDQAVLDIFVDCGVM